MVCGHLQCLPLETLTSRILTRWLDYKALSYYFNTNLPVRCFGVGQRLARQPEVAFLEGKAGEQLGSLCLVFVEEPLFNGDRGHEDSPLWHLRHCRRKSREFQHLVMACSST